MIVACKLLFFDFIYCCITQQQLFLNQNSIVNSINQSIYTNSYPITVNALMDTFSDKNLSEQKQESYHDLAMHEAAHKKLRAIKSQTCLSHSKINQLYNDSHINDRFAQLRVLTKQKDLLMTQLHSLKEGAVTALLQKEEIIDRLKNQQKYQVYFEDEKEQMQKQLNKHMRRIKQLIEQRNEITQKYEKQRIFFFDEFYNKQAIIDELSSRIANLHVENDNLSDQNKKINAQLTQSQQNVQLMKQQISEMRSQLLELYKKAQSKQKKQVNFNVEPIKICSNCQQKLDGKTHSNNQYPNDLIQELKVQYEIQIEQLTNFYEQQLGIMKAICDKQILDPGYLKKTLETQGFSDQEQNQSVLDLFSMKSGLQSKAISNLKNQLKAIKSYRPHDEDQSQFTSKYFSYQQKPRLEEKDSLESTKTINVQQLHNNFKKQQNINFATKKQVMALIGGGVLGAILWASITKLLNK